MIKAQDPRCKFKLNYTDLRSVNLKISTKKERHNRLLGAVKTTYSLPVLMQSHIKGTSNPGPSGSSTVKTFNSIIWNFKGIHYLHAQTIETIV
jgi:hypothetical protein